MQSEGFTPHEQELYERYHPVMQRIGGQLLGLDEIPHIPTRHLINGIIWEISRDDEGRYPFGLVQEFSTLAAEHIPFLVFLGRMIDAEKGFHLTDTGGALQGPPALPIHPPKEAALLPIVIIPIAPGKGLWYLVEANEAIEGHPQPQRRP